MGEWAFREQLRGALGVPQVTCLIWIRHTVYQRRVISAEPRTLRDNRGAGTDLLWDHPHLPKPWVPLPTLESWAYLTAPHFAFFPCEQGVGAPSP